VSGAQTSLLPLPKPFTTRPFNRSGKGGSGPPSGPAVRGRGASGRICWPALLTFPHAGREIADA
jgi:hypothetical protein